MRFLRLIEMVRGLKEAETPCGNIRNDVNQRLEVSINIARQSGVDESRIPTEESGYAFFLNQ